MLPKNVNGNGVDANPPELDVAVCDLCGALVANTETHTEWHEALTQTILSLVVKP